MQEEPLLDVLWVSTGLQALFISLECGKFLDFLVAGGSRLQFIKLEDIFSPTEDVDVLTILLMLTARSLLLAFFHFLSSREIGSAVICGCFFFATEHRRRYSRDFRTYNFLLTNQTF